MRKLFLMLAVLLVASAAYAVDVTISCTAEVNVVTVSYVATAEANIPRAFGLDIQLSNAETITSVTPEDPCYWVYPGSYPGTDPVGDVADSDDTLPGIDSNGVTIEMASLHSPTGSVSNPSAPGISSDLLSFTVSGDCDVAISGNAARGKVVFYDATNEDDDGRDVVYTGCTVTLITDCFSGTQQQFDNWVNWGKPANWCNSCWKCGDVTGDGFLTFGDVIAVLNDFKAANATGRSDNNMDGYLTFGDVISVLNLFKAGGGCAACD